VLPVHGILLMAFKPIYFISTVHYMGKIVNGKHIHVIEVRKNTTEKIILFYFLFFGGTGI
jgi:hypothetical protein